MYMIKLIILIGVILDSFIVVLCNLLLVPIPLCLLPQPPSLSSYLSFILPQALICCDHASKNHC